MAGRASYDWDQVVESLRAWLQREAAHGRDLRKITWTEAAKAAGVPRETLSSAKTRVGSLKHISLPADLVAPGTLAAISSAAVEEALDQAEADEVSGLTRQLDHWRGRAQSAEGLVREGAWFRSVVANAVAVQPPITPRVYVPELGMRKNPLAALLCTGDYQWGAKVEPADLMGGLRDCPESLQQAMNVLLYNPEVARERVRRTFQIWHDIVADRRQASPVPRGYILITGDLIDHSALRPGHERDLAIPNVVLQTLECYQVLLECIQGIAAEFEELYIIGVPGNHGRVSPIPGVSQPLENFDYLILYLLREALAASPHVKVVLPTAWYQIFRVDGWTFLLFHGDEIRMYLRFPRYGAETAMTGYQAMMDFAGKRAVRQAPPTTLLTPDEYQRLAPSVDVAVFGHFHMTEQFSMPGAQVMAVGSLMASSPYIAKRFHSFMEPTQIAAFIHPEHGLQLVSHIHPA